MKNAGNTAAKKAPRRRKCDYPNQEEKTQKGKLPPQTLRGNIERLYHSENELQRQKRLFLGRLIKTITERRTLKKREDNGKGEEAVGGARDGKN